MKNTDINLEILDRIRDVLLKSPEANFQKILYLSGVNELYEILDEDDCKLYLSGCDINEKSEDTLERLKANLN